MPAPLRDRSRLALPLVALAIASCRFGGPTGNPEAYITFADAGDDAGAGSAAEAGDTTGPDATVDDASEEASADDGSSADDDGGGGDGAAEGGRTSDASCVTTVPVCDPIRNTGCNAVQQCDVDTSQSKPTGLCVFNSGGDAGPCSSSIFTETCAPGSTCVGGSCRPLCFCDSDCPASQCCSTAGGLAGFGLCQVCP